MSMRRFVAVGALAALAVAGCKRGKEEQGSSRSGAASRGRGANVAAKGELLAPGQVTDLRVSPGGQFITYLLDAKKPPVDGIPPKMVVGRLHVVPATGGASRELGRGVTNDVGGLLFTPDGKHLLFLTGFEPASRSGALYAWPLGTAEGEPSKLGDAVTYMVPSADGTQLAFVDSGLLRVGPLPAGPFQDVAGEVSTAQFTPDGKSLVFKRKLSAASGLAVVALDKPGAKPVKVADEVGEYQLSPDGKRLAYQVRSDSSPGAYDLFLTDVATPKGRSVAEGTTGFAFSPDSQWLARTEGSRYEQPGDLVVGPASGEGGRKVGERVEKFAFSPDSRALGFLDSYDVAARAGLMGVVALPDGEPKKVGGRVPNFTWGSDGRFVAFLSRFPKPVHSVDLMLYTVGAEKAEKVHPGVFGYGFSPKNEDVVFRTNCIREGRACDFKAMPLPRDEKGEAATWLQGIYTYKLSDDGQRALFTAARMDSDAYDVGVYDVRARVRKTLDERVQLPVYFAGKDESRVVYLVTDGPAPGVYASSATP
ncbi:gliding motility protein [Myxococcaceae bacterium GXIMD 01537]